ncbi:MAG: serine hydrolase, partial [Proteobacteria bacterium]|nr:serine hydrolase [Pseudomonadota bacterium]
TSTFIGDADPVRLSGIAANYAVANGQFHSLPTAPVAVGAGGVRTTADDFARWLENFWTGRAGGKDVMRKMAEVPKLPNGALVDYGGGITLAAYRGLDRLEHGGSWDGFRSKMAVYPAEHFGVVVLCNRSDAGTTPRIDDVSDVYLGGLMKGPKAESSEVLQLRPLKGIAVEEAPLGAYRDKVGAEYLRIVAGPGDTRVLEYRNERRTLKLVEPGIYRADALTPFPGFDIYVAFDARGLNMSYGGDYDRFDHVEDWAPGDLTRYAGTYWSDEAQAHMTLSVKDGVLYAQMGARSAPLKPGRRGEFAFGRGGLEVPAEGPADELKVELYGLRGMVYRRLPPSAPGA